MSHVAEVERQRNPKGADFDIVATTGGKYRAVVREFTATANVGTPVIRQLVATRISKCSASEPGLRCVAIKLVGCH